MEAKLDIWIVLFIAAAAQGVFLSSMLFLKPSRVETAKKAQYLLALLMLTFTITIAYYVTYWTGISSQLSPILSIILQFTLLFGPLAYFYLYYSLRQKLPRFYGLHFLPFLLVNALMYSIQFIQPDFQSYYLFSAFASLHVLVYALYNLFFIRLENNNKWVRQVALSFLGYAICLLTYYILVWTGVLQIQHDYMVSMGMTLFIYFIGYHGFKHPVASDNKLSQEKYQKSSLTDQAIKLIAQQLDDLMQKDKLYTNGDLKLSQLASLLEHSPHVVSQVINVAKKQKYSDYLNELRVDEAIRLMKEEEYQNAKLIAIGLDAGFNNKTSFLNAFKKRIGQSPSDYRRSLYSQVS
ncbi:AraC family transcriptional regulator [Roseivirga sp. E12]|uniref:helix-turn-helix domain-containing protein n=1 Tax=Roseivirga sp. E12 TaxID=2819237 RepID=UPI001ABC6D1C|nr:AraC family transcriptional regulator [Roseivirga sp. E12]MBO3697638.1 helix-turn-helix transcriptional regulator [Roseivirga sp. E12]